MRIFHPPVIVLPVLLTIIILCPSCAPEQSKENSAPRNPVEKAVVLPISEVFDFTGENWAERLENLPPAARNDERNFLALAEKMLNEPEWVLSLVDKSHFLDTDFVAPDLVALSDYPDVSATRKDLYLHRASAESLASLSRAAADEGLSLTVSSAYRSREYQEKLFNRYVSRDGEDAASRYSARPGSSQHQLGSTVDFGDITNAFAESAEGKWLVSHAAEYGWSLSYPEGDEGKTGYMWESWHWRWIGTAAAEMQKKYFDDSQQTLLEFWHSNRDEFQRAATR